MATNAMATQISDEDDFQKFVEDYKNRATLSLKKDTVMIIIHINTLEKKNKKKRHKSQANIKNVTLDSDSENLSTSEIEGSIARKCKKKRSPNAMLLIAWRLERLRSSNNCGKSITALNTIKHVILI